MTTLELSKLDAATISEWRSRGLVILAGAFVSTFAPTNAPDGGRITKGLWDFIFGSGSWPNWLRDDFEKIPFEALMQLYPDSESLSLRIQGLYGTDTPPNPIHRCLADELLVGGLTALITTNYDLAFESCLGTDTAPCCLTVYDKPGHDAYVAMRSTGSPPRPLFKIHGTAKTGCEDTLVYNLKREGLLDPWRKSLLLELIADRVVLIIGYSGRDFDICPIIAEEAHPAQVVWLQRSLEAVTPGAKRVLNSHEGILLLGDLCELLRKLFNCPLDAKKGNGTWNPAAHFDVSLSFEWRIAILDHMGCGSYGLLATASLPEKDRWAMERRASIYNHVGRYRDSIRENEKILELIPLNDDERFGYMLSVAKGWFFYGAHVRSYRLVRRAKSWIESTPNGLTAKHRMQLGQAKIMMVMRVVQIVRLLPRWTGSGWLHRLIQEKSRGLYEQCLASLEVNGAWDSLQALQHNAERIGIARHDHLPLPAREGYESLGLLSLNAIAASRDLLRDPPYRLDAVREAAGRKAIRHARKYGWEHELWKLNWLLFWRGNWKKRRARFVNLRRWWRLFWRTQYAPSARLFQLLVNMLPQRSIKRKKVEKVEYRRLPPAEIVEVRKPGL